MPARSPIWALRFLSSTCSRDEPFHHQYDLEQVREMVSALQILRLGYSALRFNVVFVARR